MSDSKIKVLIHGAGFENKGAEAMLLTTCEELKKRIENILFFSIAKNKAECPKYSLNNITPILYRRPNLFQRCSFLINRLLSDLKLIRYLHSYNTLWQIDQIKNYDVILDISGFAYGDSWGIGAVQKAEKIVRYCYDNKKPYIFLPQAWGPFSGSGLAACVKSICQKSSLIYARDNESLSCLKAVSEPPLSCESFVPDIAFKFKGKSLDIGNKILNKVGGNIFLERKLIGIVPNSQIIKQSKGAYSFETYVDLLALVIDHCHATFNCNFVLIPHHFSGNHKHKVNDIALCSAVQSRVSKAGCCIMLSENYDASVLKSIIGCMDLLIASRFHSLVAGLSQAIPVIAIGWSHKYPELLGIFGLEKYSISSSDLNLEQLLAMIEEAIKSRDDISIKIKTDLLAVIGCVDSMFDAVACRICSRL